MTVGIGAAATVLTGGAILPVLGAIGVASGVGMAGYGTYKAATAKTDGEAKQALETLGMGVTTTVLSSAGAGKALETAKNAGVKSAEVAKDANILTTTAQMFKATPEALKVSGHNAKISLTNLFIATRGQRTLFDGTVEMREKNGQLGTRWLPDGTKEGYIDGRLSYRKFSNGDYEYYNKNGILMQQKKQNMKYVYYETGQLKSEQNLQNTQMKCYNPDGSLRYEDIGSKSSITYNKDGSRVIHEGNFIKYQNKDGIITSVKDLLQETKNDRIMRMHRFIKEAEANNAPKQVINDLKEVLGMVKQASNIDEINNLPFPSYNQGHKYAEIMRYDVDGSFADQTYHKGAGYIMKSSEVRATQELNQKVHNEPHHNLLGIDQKYYDEQIRLHGECTVPMW